MELPDQLTGRSGGGEEYRCGPDWRLAQARMLLYLSSLRIPPADSLSYALDAISQAQAEFLPDGEPIAASMRCLRVILRRKGCLPAGDPDFSGRRWFRAVNRDPAVQLHLSPCDPGRTFRSLSFPPVRRDAMPAATMKRFRPWRSTLATLRTSFVRLAAVAAFGKFSFTVLLSFLLVLTL
jgi:hypothetical protein